MASTRAKTALPIILERLHEKHPGARYELDWQTPLELLVATILAAQCTDERVNQVTKTLFRKYPDANAYAQADISVLEEDLRPTGFYREKAKKVQNACKDLVERFNGEVPADMDAMCTLYGVARKTANVVLNTAFRLPTGVIVDTHVKRVAFRMGLTEHTNPDKIETDLMALVPKEEWIFFGPAMVLHGRYTCTAHDPACADCVMNDLCPKAGVGDEEGTTGEEAPLKEDSPKMAKKTKPAAQPETPPAPPPAPAAPEAPAKEAKKKAPAKKSAPAEPAKPAIEVPSLKAQLPADWQAALAPEFDKPYFKALEKFVAEERAAGPVFPPAEEVFAAFHATPFDAVKAVILGQDPYPTPGDAHGMCFSVRPGVAVPKSLANIYLELKSDLGHDPVSHGYLASWAAQGVFLLNTILTVRAKQIASHKGQGWETFTDAVIKAISARAKPAVFVLWGNPAKEKKALIDTKKHRVVESGHPSPLSAAKGFFGTKPFSSTNAALKDLGQGPIEWKLPDDPSQTTAAPTEAAPPAKPKAEAKPKAAKPAAAPPTAAPEPPPTIEAGSLAKLLPEAWRKVLAAELTKPYFRQLEQFVGAERKAHTVCPREQDVFAALELTPPDGVRVVMIDEEPPCDADEADGLAFSMAEGTGSSDVLDDMAEELRRELGCRLPTTGHLTPWARQGVLLLNKVLTVREDEPESHAGKGWETFTDAIVKAVSASQERAVFVFVGEAPPKKLSAIDQDKLTVIVVDYFDESGAFGEINSALATAGRSPVYWQLPYA